eukprot:jgi/Galph1/2215/GphlegSOOS_G901.1
MFSKALAKKQRKRGSEASGEKKTGFSPRVPESGTNGTTERSKQNVIQETGKVSSPGGSHFKYKDVYSQSMPEISFLERIRQHSSKKAANNSSEAPLSSGEPRIKTISSEWDNCSYSEGEELDRPASIAAEELFDEDEEVLFLEETLCEQRITGDDDEEEFPDSVNERSEPSTSSSLALGGDNSSTKLKCVSASSVNETKKIVHVTEMDRAIPTGSIPWIGADRVDMNYIYLLLHRFQELTYQIGWREDVTLQKNIFSPFDARRVIKEVTSLVSSEPTVLEISVPEGGCVRVIDVGDIHGHLYDLGSILEVCGAPGPRNILVFNGDYVDRGSWGMEVLLILCILKLWQPKSIGLLRGNHESSYCNVIYGFRRECLQKYSIKLYLNCQNLFSSLPVAAVISNKPCPSAASSVSTPIPVNNLVSDNDKSWSSSLSSSLRGLFRVAKSSSPPNKHSLNSTNFNLDSLDSSPVSRIYNSNQGKDIDSSTGSLPEISPSSSFYSVENCPFVHRPPHYTLPLQADEKRVLVLHGGLFRRANGDIGDLKVGYFDYLRFGCLYENEFFDLNEVRRNFVDPVGSIEDVLWSDPDHINGFGPNRWRGAGIAFGPDVTLKFLKSNRLYYLIRSHEGPDAREKRTEFPLLNQGYSIDFKFSKKVSSSSTFRSELSFPSEDKSTCKDFEVEERPLLLTVFSAPSYPEGPNARKNKGAICILDESLEPQFETFSAMERPERSQTTNLMFGDLARDLNEAALERSKLGRMWLKLSGRG